MNSINALCGLSTAVVLQLGMLAGSAQTNQYSFGFTGSKTNITLNSGNYEITAYGAQGAAPVITPGPSDLKNFLNMQFSQFQDAMLKKLGAP
jgi:hypothetical protein